MSDGPIMRAALRLESRRLPANVVAYITAIDPTFEFLTSLSTDGWYREVCTDPRLTWTSHMEGDIEE